MGCIGPAKSLSTNARTFVAFVTWYAIEREGEVNTLTPLDLNQQVLRKIGRQGSTIKVVGEKNGKLTISLALWPVEATEVKVSRVA